MELYGMSKEDILKQVRAEYEYGYQFVEGKRQQRREDEKRYLAESEDDKVHIHSIYTSIQTLMAIFYLNKIGVEFTRRKIGDQEIASNANKVAEYDYNEMELDVIDYDTALDSFKFGVGIQVSDGFDKVRKVPRIKRMSPLSWIPDPEGGATISDHRFCGFETMMTHEEMESYGYEVEDLEDSTEVTQEINRTYGGAAQGYSKVTDDTENRYVDAYVHFTMIEGKKYRVVAAKNRTKLIDFTYLNPVFEEEKQDTSLVPYPVALYYYSYDRGNPLGISVPDLLRDKQTAYSKLFNLLLIMATRNALGSDKLVNTKKVKDLAGLMKPTVGGKYIPVNIGDNENISNVIAEVQKDTPTQLPFNMKEFLDEQIIVDSGIDRNTIGVLGTQNATLGEREMAQRNANMRFLLASKQRSWGESFRWKYLWYRVYVANFKTVYKKQVALGNSYTTSFFEFNRDDFLGSDMLHLKLVNKAERQQELQRLKADRMAVYPQLIANARSEGERTFLQREMMRAYGEDEDTVMRAFPLNHYELDAMEKAVLINNGDELGMKVDSIDDDHYVYLRIFETCDDNDVKRMAISRRMEALRKKEAFDKEQEMMMAQAQGGLANESKSAMNTATTQLVNQSIQSQQKRVPSLQDMA